jgi:hypothetical protein
MPALILAAVLAAQPVPPPHAASPCDLPRTTATAWPRGPARLNRLGDLPDAHAMHAVQRRVGGCEVAEVTRFNVSDPKSPSGVAWVALGQPPRAGPAR